MEVTEVQWQPAKSFFLFFFWLAREMISLSIDERIATIRMKVLTLAMDSEEGVPSKSVMRSNWCTTFFPGNRGFPESISANMHPMLQISIAGVYCQNVGDRKLNI